MKPLQTFKLWPPLVNATGIPLFVRVRDIVVTLCAWALLTYLLREALHLAWDYLRYPVFELTTASPPDWRVLWSRLSNYSLFVAAMMTWLLVWGHYRRATLAASAPQPQPPALPAEVHLRSLNLPVEQLAVWQSGRRLIVNFDDKGAIASVASVASADRP